jgi:hypothetical protein
MRITSRPIIIRNQSIMLNLQQKAHYSLDEFRKGHGSTLNRSEPATPVDDNDELSVLGGKTRLVAKQEPSSPTIMDRSPTTQNPVVPLPLSPSMEGRMHPSIWEYLNTFTPQQVHNHNHNQSSSGQHSSSSLSNGISPNQSSYSEDVSMYGMSTLPTPSAFQSEPGPYVVNHQPPTAAIHAFSHHRQGSHPSQMGNTQTSNANTSVNGTHSFPQYFPVYDYGNGMSNRPMNGNYANGNGFVMSPESPMLHSARRGSGSPETNMQSTWHDFVTEMAV